MVLPRHTIATASQLLMAFSGLSWVILLYRNKFQRERKEREL